MKTQNLSKEEFQEQIRKSKYCDYLAFIAETALEFKSQIQAEISTPEELRNTAKRRISDDKPLEDYMVVIFNAGYEYQNVHIRTAVEFRDSTKMICDGDDVRFSQKKHNLTLRVVSYIENEIPTLSVTRKSLMLDEHIPLEDYEKACLTAFNSMLSKITHKMVMEHVSVPVNDIKNMEGVLDALGISHGSFHRHQNKRIYQYIADKYSIASLPDIQAVYSDKYSYLTDDTPYPYIVRGYLNGR